MMILSCYNSLMKLQKNDRGGGDKITRSHNLNMKICFKCKGSTLHKKPYLRTLKDLSSFTNKRSKNGVRNLQKNTHTQSLRMSSSYIFRITQCGGNPDALYSLTLVHVPLIIRTDLFKTKIKKHDLV